MAQIHTTQVPNVGLPGGENVSNSNFEGTITLPAKLETGKQLTGTLDFTVQNTGAGWNQRGLAYELVLHGYNSNDQEIQTTKVFPTSGRRNIYYPASSSCSAQWSSGKMFNWGIGKFVSGSSWASVKSTLQADTEWQSYPYTSSVPENPSISGVLTYNGCQTGNYGGFINPEPMIIRYASDNVSSRANIYVPLSKSKAMKWSKANPYRASSIPSGGDRSHTHSPVSFNFTLGNNVAYINFSVKFYSIVGEIHRTDITFPAKSAAKTDPATVVDPASYIYRYTGSQWVLDSVVTQVINSTRVKCKVYRYNGSSWVKIN